MRSCKDCTLCCELLGINEIDKPAFSKCWNQTRTGCSVYADRPPSCRQFDCAWRRGDVPKHLKPNKTGAVITSNGRMIMVYSNLPLQTKVQEYLREHAVSGLTVVVAIQDKRWTMTRAGALSEVIRSDDHDSALEPQPGRAPRLELD